MIGTAPMKILELSAASPEQYHDAEITIMFELFLFRGAASSHSLCYSANLLNGLDSRMRIHRFRYLYHGFIIALLFLVFIPSSVFAQANSQAPEQSAGDAFDDLAKSAAAARDANNIDVAVQNYQRAVAIRPDWQEGWWYLGTLQYDANHYPEAIAALQKLVLLAPQIGPAWAFLGLSKFETKDYENALAHLERAQAIGMGDDADLARVSTYHLALLLIHAGEFERATTLLGAEFGQAGIPKQAKAALGLALLRVPLLPEEVNPSKDALIEAAGDVAAIVLQQDAAKAVDAFQVFVKEFPATPYLHYAYGLALASASQNQEALIEQQKESEISPRSPLPQIEISSLDIGLQHPEEALSAAQKAVSLAPNSAAAHRALEQSLEALGKNQDAARETQAADALSPEKPLLDDTVIQLYHVHSTEEPPPNGELWKLAMLDYSSGKFSEAISSLKTWVVDHPDDGTAWAVMGLSEFEIKDFDNALIHLQRGQQLGLKGSAEAIQLARYRLASLLNRTGLFDRALELLAHEETSGPLNERIKIARGMSLLRIPMLPEEIEVADKPLLETAGEIAALMQQSKYDEAFAKFQPLLRDHPGTPFLHYTFGNALAVLSRYDAAEEQMKLELEISQKSELPWVSLASIELREHRAAEAAGFAQQALNLAPSSAEARYLLGRAQLDLGHADLAIQELEAASKIAPDSPEIHFNLAKAYAKTNQPEKADAERAIFVRLNALSEQQRGLNGNQNYTGPRDAAGLSIPQAAGSAGAAEKPD
jgi:tetratricopeptide (TPR) repeat protein